MTEWTSPKPLPVPIAMSSRLPDPPAPEATPAPKPTSTEGSTDTARKEDKVEFPTPKLRLEIRDLRHSGTSKFIREISADKAVYDAIETVIALLYDTTAKKIQHPPVRSITLVLRSMGGVAYTTGTELDDEHKEIHLSLEYVNSQPDNRIRHEILGVIVHEMVHVWQWNALGTCPGGLIEGIADYVRLKAGYAPPHWKRTPGDKWDAGYERTGFFLEWLEKSHGDGKVVELNGALRHKKYDEKIWKEVFGHNVADLFKSYQEEYEKETH